MIVTPQALVVALWAEMNGGTVRNMAAFAALLHIQTDTGMKPALASFKAEWAFADSTYHFHNLKRRTLASPLACSQVLCRGAHDPP